MAYPQYDPQVRRQEVTSASQFAEQSSQVKAIRDSVKDIGQAISRQGLAIAKANQTMVKELEKANKGREANEKFKKKALEDITKNFQSFAQAWRKAQEDAKKALKLDGLKGIAGNAKKTFAESMKAMKPVGDFIKKTTSLLKNNLGALLKGLMAGLMILKPEEFAKALQAIVQGVMDMKAFFTSDGFKKFLKDSWEFMKWAAGVSWTALKEMVKGIIDIGQAFQALAKGNFKEAWNKFIEGILKAWPGLLGLAAVLNPTGTLLLGFAALNTGVNLLSKGLSALVTTVGTLGKGFKGIITLLAKVPYLAHAMAMVGAPIAIATTAGEVDAAITRDRYGGGEAGEAGLALERERMALDASIRNRRGRVIREFTPEEQARRDEIEAALAELKRAKEERDRAIKAATQRETNRRGQTTITRDEEAYQAALTRFEEERLRIFEQYAIKLQRGGHLNVPGHGDGDKVPMMLPPGSFVMNRNAALHYANGGLIPTLLEPGEKVFGPGQWGPLEMGMNNTIRRFAEGGLIEHLHGDPTRPGYDPHGHGTEANAHDHFAFSSVELRQAVQRELERRGYTIGSVLRPGDPGYHGVGQAFDVPWSQFGSGPITEQDFVRSRQLAADVKEILASLNASSGPLTGDPGSGTSPVGPGAGPMQTIQNVFAHLTGGFSKMWEVIAPIANLIGPMLGGLFNQFTGIGPATATGTPPGGSYQSQDKQKLKKLAMEAGFSEAEANTMAAIALAESSGNPNAHNGVYPDNSYGLWQINMLGAMGPERRAQLGITSNEQLFDPATNARAARMIFQQQGYGAWSVYTNGSYRQYLQSGGVVGMQSGGQVSSAPSTSSSFYRSMSRGARNAGAYDGGGPVVVMAGGSGPGTGTRGATSGTTKPPSLPASPRTLVAADYLARVGMGMKLA